MKAPSFLLFSVLFVMSVMHAVGGESLKNLLQERTVDVDAPGDRTVAGAFADLNERYRAKYGGTLPIFVSVELLAPQPKPEPAKIPGLDVPGVPKAPGPLPGGGRIGGMLHNVPLVDALRYYANLANAECIVREDMILIHKAK